MGDSSLRRPHGSWVEVMPLAEEGAELDDEDDAVDLYNGDDEGAAGAEPSLSPLKRPTSEGDVEGLQAQALADAAQHIHDALTEAEAIHKPVSTTYIHAEREAASQVYSPPLCRVCCRRQVDGLPQASGEDA